MIVSMWMTREIVVIEPGKLITEAAALMADKRVRRLPVVEQHADGARLLGIVSKGDLLHAFPSDINPFAVRAVDGFQTDITTADVMSRQLQTTTPDAPIELAAEVMRNRNIGALPVVHGGVLVGLITESDIFRAFVSLFAATPGSARITFDMSRGDDAYALVARLAPRRKVRVLSLITSQQDDRPVCVVRITGADVEQLLDDIWKSGHPVLNVLRH